MRLLVTRPQEDAADLARALTARGHEAVLCPLLLARFVPISLVVAYDCKALIVTSKNALRSLSHSPEALEAGRERTLYVTGPGTADFAHSLGFRDIRQGPGTAAGLPLFIWETLGSPGATLTYLAGDETAFDLETALKAWDYRVRKIIAYRVEAAEQLDDSVEAEIRSGRVEGVILMSPRTAVIFSQLLKRAGLASAAAGLRAYCLSENVAAKLEGVAREAIRIAATPDLEGLLSNIEKDVRG